ncbi:MAG: hypothetical protein RMJ98_05390 [Myxococcales bacterium]|nr:hypothetical protein [Polyangiaceae bacterium]MDW8248724.1 hypothetical protein [Myxococcales bacterium]
MARSLLAPPTLGGLSLLESGPDDRYFDYCLEPYRPRRPWRGMLRGENIFWQSLALGGALDSLRPPLLALQSSLGPDMTVWGVKWDGTRLFWEVYIYDPLKEEPAATVSSLSTTLAPWLRVIPSVSESAPYVMVSFDLDPTIAARGTIDELNLYLTGEQGQAGRVYKVRSGEAELENTYRFLPPKTGIGQILPLIKASVFVDFSDPTHLARILIPELFACRKICVAKKRRCDAIYFSGVPVDRLLFFLRRFRYPAPLVEFLAYHQERFEHLLFDMGLDYRQGQDGAILYPKTSFYGTL